MRDYVQPKIPGNWQGGERTYANMLQDVLDDLHMPIREDWLSKELQGKLKEIDTIPKQNTQDYSEEAKDTGLLWTDGSKIYRVTQEVSIAANVETDGDSIENFGVLIKAEGYVITSAGACYPVGCNNGTVSVNVWKNANADTYRILSSVSGTAHITVYYVEGEVTPTTDTYIFFDNGYTRDGNDQAIAWGANQLTRPSDSTHGYTTLGAASLERAESQGYLWLYTNTVSSYYYNSHVCTANLIHIPSDATKLKVTAARGPNPIQIALGLLPNDAPNSMDVSEGGKISTYFTLTTTQTEYILALDNSMQGSDSYRIVVNMRGKGDVYRSAQIYKVEFE